MRKLFLRISSMAAMVLFALAIVTLGQDRTEASSTVDAKPADVRANALRQLGLTREQLAEIRKVNQARKPLMEEAQGRLRRANRALDEAIYADSVNESVFDVRLKEFHAAQTEVARIRFVNELAVRRVLSPEQLGRFRQMRERFDRARMARDPGSIGNKPPRVQKIKRAMFR